MRSLVRFALASFVLIATASSASAQGWGRGFFEQWSGPGGFTGYDVTVTPLCELDDDARGTGSIVILGQGNADAENTRWCLDVGFGFYENREEDRDRNGKITLKKYQAIAMASPFANGALEFGAGAGITDFDGPDFGFTRFHVPARFAFKPFRLGRDTRAVRWTGIVQLVGNLHVFPKAIRAEDVNFTEHPFEHHFQGNLMLFFDFSNAIFRR